MDWREERAGSAGTSTALVSLRANGARALPRGMRGWVDRARGLAADARRLAEDFATLTLGRDFEQRAQHIRDHYARMGDDPFGLDPESTRLGAMATAFMHRRYFRTEVHGIEHVPPGRALLIANHSGQIPIEQIDELLTGNAVFAVRGGRAFGTGAASLSVGHGCLHCFWDVLQTRCQRAHLASAAGLS